MKERELICIGCPMGCPIVVKMEEGKVISVTGNTCPRGDAYARKEVTDPTRIVTTTVRVADGNEQSDFLPFRKVLQRMVLCSALRLPEKSEAFLPAPSFLLPLYKRLIGKKKRQVVAPGEMEQVILKKKKLEEYPETKKITIRIEEA